MAASRFRMLRPYPPASLPAFSLAGPFTLAENLRVKLDFDQLAGLSWRGYPFPFLNGVMCRLCQKWMSALNRDRLRGPVRSDHGFYFHASLQLHATGGWDTGD